jgi:Ca2+-binding EF-hand superfamily protein
MLSFKDYIEENYKELLPYAHEHNRLYKQYHKLLKKGSGNLDYEELDRLLKLMQKNGDEMQAHVKRLKDKQ